MHISRHPRGTNTSITNSDTEDTHLCNARIFEIFETHRSTEVLIQIMFSDGRKDLCNLLLNPLPYHYLFPPLSPPAHPQPRMPWSLTRCFFNLLSGCFGSRQERERQLETEDYMAGQKLPLQTHRKGSSHLPPTPEGLRIPASEPQGPCTSKPPPLRTPSGSSGPGLGFFANAHHFTLNGLHVTNGTPARASKDGEPGINFWYKQELNYE